MLDSMYFVALYSVIPVATIIIGMLGLQGNEKARKRSKIMVVVGIVLLIVFNARLLEEEQHIAAQKRVESNSFWQDEGYADGYEDGFEDGIEDASYWLRHYLENEGEGWLDEEQIDQIVDDMRHNCP